MGYILYILFKHTYPYHLLLNMDRIQLMGQNWRNWRREEDEFFWQNNPRMYGINMLE